MPAPGMTYTTLIQDIKRYLERGNAEDVDVNIQIPRSIMLAENRLAVELKTLAGIRYVNTTLVANQYHMIKPDRWRDTVSFSYLSPDGERKYMFLRNYEFVRSYWPDGTLTDPNPVYYADYDFNHFLIAPTPSVDLSAELAYFQKIQPLDETNQTNWFTENAPQILLYAALYELMVFLKDDDRIQSIQLYYDRALQSLMGEDSSRMVDRTQSAESR